MTTPTPRQPQRAGLTLARPHHTQTDAPAQRKNLRFLPADHAVRRFWTPLQSATLPSPHGELPLTGLPARVAEALEWVGNWLVWPTVVAVSVLLWLGV